MERKRFKKIQATAKTSKLVQNIMYGFNVFFLFYITMSIVSIPLNASKYLSIQNSIGKIYTSNIVVFGGFLNLLANVFFLDKTKNTFRIVIHWLVVVPSVLFFIFGGLIILIYFINGTFYGITY